jgi:uncharacterized repeat protein (TIGR03803 family)
MSTRILTAIFAASLMGLMSLVANAQTPTVETILHTFLGGSDGGYPVGGVIFDAAGNLYGTTSGGHNVQSTVFELSPVAGGGWAETVLHSFGSGSNDSEIVGGLVFDATGNLYGTTLAGGKFGWGTVFELSPASGGGWTATILHSFSDPEDGVEPLGKLIFDSTGNLYGSTSGGGTHSAGTVFELKPGTKGWTKSTLHNFGAGHDGIYPYGNLVFDQAGNLYGTTDKGGAYNNGGIAFKLTPNSDGEWTEQVLHNFGRGKDGYEPTGGLVLDADGNIYGSTGQGGTHGYGTVFEITAVLGERILHSFDIFSEGSYPNSNLILDSVGNLYGETFFGGAVGCYERPGCGTAFKLSPTVEGGWQETVLQAFSVSVDGGDPSSPLLRDSAGNLYGTTYGGSETGALYGAVFEIAP